MYVQLAGLAIGTLKTKGQFSNSSEDSVNSEIWFSIHTLWHQPWNYDWNTPGLCQQDLLTRPTDIIGQRVSKVRTPSIQLQDDR
jgi:hypothetical protein